MDKHNVYQKLRDCILPVLKEENMKFGDEEDVMELISEILSDYIIQNNNIPNLEHIQPGEFWLKWPKKKLLLMMHVVKWLLFH